MIFPKAWKMPQLDAGQGGAHSIAAMTTMTVKQLEHDVPSAIHRVTAEHDAVVLEKEGHAVAVIIPAEQYFEAKDADIPESFWQGLKESRAGYGVDMEKALNEPPPGV